MPDVQYARRERLGITKLEREGIRDLVLGHLAEIEPVRIPSMIWQPATRQETSTLKDAWTI
jgi:hypothetical protein